MTQPLSSDDPDLEGEVGHEIRQAPEELVKPPARPLVRRSRRLTDHLLSAVHTACDEGELEIARRLLIVTEMAASGGSSPPGQERRLNSRMFVAAYERLWHLQNSASKEKQALPGSLN